MGRRLRVEADGGSRGNPGPAGYGAVVRDADTGEVLTEVAEGIGTASNNVAEYRGLIAGLEAALALDPESVEVRMDSMLVVQQMAGRWRVKHPDMARLKAEADELVRRLPRVRYVHIARELNAEADQLANEAMDAAARGLPWVRRTGPAVEAGTGPAPNRLSGWTEPTSPPTTTVLVRHGETPLSVERRFSGIGDPELTERGREQAAAAAERVAELAKTAPLAAVWSSPLRRAQATAEAIAERLGLAVQVESGLRETDFGDWEGYTLAEIRERWPAELTAWLASTDLAPPYGESFAATAVRVGAARDAIVAAHPGEAVVVVSHVTPIKAMLRVALDAPAQVLYRLHLDLASMTEIDWYADGAAVVRSVNDTCHLPLGADPA